MEVNARSNDNLWSVSDVARFFKSTNAAVRQWVKLGKMCDPAMVQPGGRMYFNADDVRQLAAKRLLIRMLQGSPDQDNAAEVIGMLERGEVTPEQIANEIGYTLEFVK